MKQLAPDPSLPFSRPIMADHVRDSGLQLVVTADAAERAALAKVDGLDAIGMLVGDFTVLRHGRGGLRVHGEVRASVTQICVVSLEPFDTEVRTCVDMRYASPAESEAAQAQALLALEDATDKAQALAAMDNVPDPIENGRVDLGALAAEFLTLALDPYPRKPGAAFEADVAEPADDPAPASPFAALRALKAGED